jgi:hypothetical protein
MEHESDQAWSAYVLWLGSLAIGAVMCAPRIAESVQQRADGRARTVWVEEHDSVGRSETVVDTAADETLDVVTRARSERAGSSGGRTVDLAVVDLAVVVDPAVTANSAVVADSATSISDGIAGSTGAANSAAEGQEVGSVDLVVSDESVVLSDQVVSADSVAAVDPVVRTDSVALSNGLAATNSVAATARAAATDSVVASDSVAASDYVGASGPVAAPGSVAAIGPVATNDSGAAARIVAATDSVAAARTAAGSDSLADPARTVAASDSVSAADAAPRPPHVLVVGDSMAQPLGYELMRIGARDGSLTAEVDFKIASSLGRPEYFDWPARMSELASRGWSSGEQSPDWVVVFIGGNETLNMWTDDGLATVHTPEWIVEYRKRAGSAMDVWAGSGARLLWVGLPPMADAARDSIAGDIDTALAAEAARRPFVEYVAIRAEFEGPNAAYAAFLTSHDGGLFEARQRDGIHLSPEGTALLAAHIAPLLALERLTAVMSPSSQRQPQLGGGLTEREW